MSNIVISNFDELMSDFDGLYKEGLKATQRCMRAGARAVSKRLRAASPQAFRSIIGATLKRTREGVYSMYIGFNNKEGLPKGDKIPTWFKAYWSNYGTLANRDPDHKFTRPVRKKRQSVRGGIQPRNFFETGIEGWDVIYTNSYEQQLDKEVADL